MSDNWYLFSGPLIDALNAGDPVVAGFSPEEFSPDSLTFQQWIQAQIPDKDLMVSSKTDSEAGIGWGKKIFNIGDDGRKKILFRISFYLSYFKPRHQELKQCISPDQDRSSKVVSKQPIALMIPIKLDIDSVSPESSWAWAAGFSMLKGDSDDLTDLYIDGRYFPGEEYVERPSVPAVSPPPAPLVRSITTNHCNTLTSQLYRFETTMAVVDEAGLCGPLNSWQDVSGSLPVPSCHHYVSMKNYLTESHHFPNPNDLQTCWMFENDIGYVVGPQHKMRFSTMSSCIGFVAKINDGKNVYLMGSHLAKSTDLNDPKFRVTSNVFGPSLAESRANALQELSAQHKKDVDRYLEPKPLVSS